MGSIRQIGYKDFGGKNAELAQKIAILDAEARENWYNDEWRAEHIHDVQTTIFEGFTHESLLGLMSTVETVDEGERIVIEEVRGLKVWFVSAGGQIDESTITSESAELRRDFVGYHVNERTEKIRSGFSRQMATMATLAISQMDAAINQRLLGAFQAAIDNASPYYISGAGLSLPALNTAITEVVDETLDGPVTVVGRGTMVDQIVNELQDLNGFTPASNEEILRTGRLGEYRGTNIVRLKNHKDADGNSFFPDNEMFVLGADASKTGFWGGMHSAEWTTPEGFYTNILGVRTFGCAVHHPERARRIVDTSL
ncbi:MAG: hypothetical protein KA758_03720 [Acidimicrobiales bacterium]|jgi:hypothetical protein|nr:hypothetical protein [Acidimicrobiales bacterium]